MGSMVCPACRSEMSRNKVKTPGPFPCPNCGRLLRIASLFRYRRVPMYVSLVLSVSLGYLLKLKVTAFVFFVPLAWILIAGLLGLLLGSLLVVLLDFKVIHLKLEEYYPDYLDLHPRI